MLDITFSVYKLFFKRLLFETLKNVPASGLKRLELNLGYPCLSQGDTYLLLTICLTEVSE